jgi:hypothetical protein
VSTRVTGAGVTELQILSAKLKAADPALRRALYKRLRAEAKPAADAVRRSALDMPAAKYRRGLREEVAATITVSASVTKAGAQVKISSLGSRMPEGKRNLPMHMDRSRGWGHPVFADPSKPRAEWTWVRQWGRAGWFENPVIARAGRLRSACQKAIDETLRKLG